MKLTSLPWKSRSIVAPCVGAWIETGDELAITLANGRALRGRVD